MLSAEHIEFVERHWDPIDQRVANPYALYATSPRTVDAIPWYRVLACYRLGIILEGTNARAHAGPASQETGDRLHEAVSLFRQALDLISRAG